MSIPKIISKTSGPGFYTTEENCIICNETGKPKPLLFAKQKENIYAFQVFSGDVIITKEESYYIFTVVIIFNGVVKLLDALYCQKKDVPVIFQEAVKALDRKLSGKKSCQYKKNIEKDIIGKMIKGLNEYKNTGNEEILQQLTADFSALTGGKNE